MKLINFLKEFPKSHILLKRKFLILTSLFFVWLILYPFIPINVTESNATFKISHGTNLNQITDQLVETKLLNDSFRFKALTFVSGNQKKLKKGYYKLAKSTTPLQLLDILVNGKETLYSITFKEGETYSSMVLTLTKNPNIIKTLTNLNEKKILTKIGAKEDFIEGIFFPDTYYFHRNTTDVEILKNAYQVMQAKINFLWENRTSNLPYKNPYEALIIASIIEKEVGIKEEAAEIAGVFVNRLFKGMRLQSDPTVIYGMGEKFKGNIRRADLKKDNKFNTYTRKGIPPSPIALSSYNSLEAALNPATTENLYFVAKGNRRHKFSKTLKEHNKAVYKYQKKRKRK